MASYVRLDKINASTHGNIESVVHSANLENGMVCMLGSLVNGERELYNVAIPTNATIITDEILLIASPEIMYDERLDRLRDFFISANKPARAYHFAVGDEITISDDGITGDTVVDQFVVPANNSLRFAAAAVDPGVAVSRFCAKVVSKETWSEGACTTIKVLRV
ncbi:MAG: hypothetical protein PHU66_08050 [Bacteroidaceae bacterium]|nr:hypothetical protein [Bacteroidaceae bacterium]